MSNINISDIILEVVDKLTIEITIYSDKGAFKPEIIVRSLDYDDENVQVMIDFNAISLSPDHNWKNESNFNNIVEGDGWVKINIEKDYDNPFDKLTLSAGFSSGVDGDDIIHFTVNDCDDVTILMQYIYDDIDAYNETIKKLYDAGISYKPARFPFLTSDEIE